MSPAPRCLIFVTQLGRVVFILGFLTLLVQGSIHDVFNVKSGTSKGGCDGTDVEQWFADSLTLAASAAAGAGATDADSRKYLSTFFSIRTNQDAGQASGPIGQVESVLKGNAEPPGGKPWLFCNSDWLIGKPRTDGKKVEDVEQQFDAKEGV
ncbi:hypothetical protein CDD83_11011 [Cordyceps sp. RAO-2017]|nr:hypothetical protein CDD83_11011 [Cordyceps sp. RAO-2017]